MNVYNYFICLLSRKLKTIPLAIKRKQLEKNGKLTIGKPTYGYENIDFHTYQTKR